MHRCRPRLQRTHPPQLQGAVMDAKLEVDQMMKDLYAKGVKVVYKEGRWWSFLNWLVTVLSFGQNRSFKNYVTTIWKTIAVPRESWDRWPAVVQLEVLTHEAKHVEQFRKWTPPLFALLYVLFPLPLGLAWFRYKMERDAYAAG